MIPPGTVLQEGVVSELGGTVAPDAFILTNAEQKADYALPEQLANGGSGVGRGGGSGEAAAVASQEVARRVGVRHRRGWNEMDEKGFRRCEERGVAVFLLAFDDHFAFTHSRQNRLPLVPYPSGDKGELLALFTGFCSVVFDAIISCL